MSQNEVVVRAKIAVDATELKTLREETARWGGGAGGGQGGAGGGGGASSGGGGPPGAPPVPGSREDSDAPTVITHLPPPPTPGGGGASASSMGGPGGMAAPAGAMSLLIQSAQIIVQNGQFAMQGGGPPPPGGAAVAAGGAGSDWDGGGSRDPRRSPPPPNQGSGIPGAGFISNTASTATGIALGSSIIGFLTGSAERWQETDKALGALDRRFEALDRKAGNFAASMGVVRAEAAALLETLGAQTNTVDLGQARMGVGFARTTGTDPAAAMRFLGTGSRLGGFRLDSLDMRRVYGQAKMAGQGDGMLPEFMESLTALMQQQFQTTGVAGLPTAQTLMNIPGILFGAGDPRALGMGGVSTLQSMQGMLSGSTSPGMGVEMLRAMRYGRDGGPGYLDAMERREAGVFDPRNLVDMFGMWRKRGITAERATEMSLQDARRSGMSTKTWRAIVSRGMSDAGFSALQDNLDSASMLDWLGEAGTAMLSPEEQAIAAKSGWAGTGANATVLSQHRQRQLDDMTASVGPQMLKSVVDLTATAANMGTVINEVIKAFTGGDGFLDVVNKATGEIRGLSENAARAARVLNTSDIASFEEGDAARFGAEMWRGIIAPPAIEDVNKLRMQWGMAPLGTK